MRSVVVPIWVTYTGNAPGDPRYGQWQSIDLVQDSSDSTLWSQSIDLSSPGSVRFMVQAVNGVGLVSLDTNVSAYYVVGINPTIPPTTPATPTTLTLDSSIPGANPSTGAYGTTVTFAEKLTPIGSSTGVSGQTVTFVLSGQQHQVVTDGNGVASTSFNLISTPNPYSVEVSFAGTDAYGPSSTTIPITITKRTTKLTLSTPSPLPVQYSDPVDVIAKLTDDADHPLVNKTIFFVVTDSNNVTVAGATAITGFDGQAHFGPSPVLLSPNGGVPYKVTASFGGTITIGGKTTTFSDPNYADSTMSTSLTVNPEDARAYYTGTMLAWTPKATSTTATVSLSATVKDISAVTGDPAYDSYPGDIRRATVTFFNGDTNAKLCSAPVGLVGATDQTVGTATCNVTLSTGPTTVEIVVNGYYTYTNVVVVTVAQPNVANSINGGGYLTLTNSAGQFAGDPGSNSNFGFNVKYNKAGTSLQGSVNISGPCRRRPRTSGG